MEEYLDVEEKILKIHSLALELSIDNRVGIFRRLVYRFIWWWIH